MLRSYLEKKKNYIKLNLSKIDFLHIIIIINTLFTILKKLYIYIFKFNFFFFLFFLLLAHLVIILFMSGCTANFFFIFIFLSVTVILFFELREETHCHHQNGIHLSGEIRRLLRFRDIFLNL